MLKRFIAILILLFTTSAGLLANDNPTLKAGEGFVEVNGGKIWYEILGEGDAAPLIMMHGGPGGTSRSFYLFEKLSKNQPLIIFDQLGGGQSDRHEDTSLLYVHEFVDQVERLKEHLKLDEYLLYGHSWGTALALECYTADPEGVKGIIFNSPYFSTAIWEADADTLITYLPQSTQNAIAKGEATGIFNSISYQQANSVFAANYGLRGKRKKNKLDVRKQPGNYFIYNYMWGPTEFTATGTLKNYDSVDKLKKINVPTLFITGEFDEARPTTVKYFQSLVPNAQFYIVKNAGHSTMHDNLCQNRKAIAKFLKALQ